MSNIQHGMSNIQGNYHNFFLLAVFILLNNIEFNSPVFQEKINFLRLLNEFVFSSLHRLDIPCWILDIQSFYPLDLRRSRKKDHPKLFLLTEIYGLRTWMCPMYGLAFLFVQLTTEFPFLARHVETEPQFAESDCSFTEIDSDRCFRKHVS